MKTRAITQTVRRIYLDRVVDQDGLLSYGLLARWAILYSPAFNPEDQDKESTNDWKSLTRLFAVEITYVDDEGDSICFSSDEELIDALLLFSKRKDDKSNGSVIFRCKAIVEERKVKSRRNKKSCDAVATETKCSSIRHLASFDGPQSFSKKIAANCSLPDDVAGFDRGFVHARHTCDGCGIAPIVGIRYHAQNIPDYDYCESCMANYHGTDVAFQPEQLGCDERFQLHCKRNRCKVENFLEAFQISMSQEGSKAFSNREVALEKDLIDLAEPAEKKKEGFESLHDSDKVAKAIDVIGMTIIQSVSIIGSVLNDILENSKMTKDIIIEAAPNHGQPHVGTILSKVKEEEDQLKDVSLATRANEFCVPEKATIHTLPDSLSDAEKQLGDSEKPLEVQTEKHLKQQHFDIIEAFTEEEWNMVESGRDALVTIGSALYREDLIRSTEALCVNKDQNVEAEPSGGECIKSVLIGSVASLDEDGSLCTPSVQESNNPYLLARWDKELDELRQMGFLDDQKSLEALEALEAADIGVDSDNEISVTMAVNWLLNHAGKA